MSRRFYVITGGTMVHVAPHFSLCAPAYGKVGKQIARELQRLWNTHEGIDPNDVIVLRTKMALGSDKTTREERETYKAAGVRALETNDDLEKVIDHLILQPETKGIVLAAAVCDWQFRYLVQKTDGPETGEDGLETWTRSRFGKDMPRLQTSAGDLTASLTPSDKIIGKIRKVRKDIFLVGFKATTGMSEQEQYVTGLGLMKSTSCNLVLANDVHEHRNMVITPEEAKYHVTTKRDDAIKGLCEMIVLRSNLHFTRSDVVEGDPIPWGSDEIPETLRRVVDHCITRGAYKPFQGKTVGHFATRGPREGTIYTSRRKSNFNNLAQDGLLRIDAVGDDRVIAHGGKPSVGGQSQRIIFTEHSDVDCIVHFHCPMKKGKLLNLDPSRNRRQRWSGRWLPDEAPDKVVPVREQRPYECGSHECGKNTSDGLREVAYVRTIDGTGTVPVKIVMLDEHGPNICFPKEAAAAPIVALIEDLFDLEAKTGGPVALG